MDGFSITTKAYSLFLPTFFKNMEFHMSSIFCTIKFVIDWYALNPCIECSFLWLQLHRKEVWVQHDGSLPADIESIRRPFIRQQRDGLQPSPPPQPIQQPSPIPAAAAQNDLPTEWGRRRPEVRGGVQHFWVRQPEAVTLRVVSIKHPHRYSLLHPAAALSCRYSTIRPPPPPQVYSWTRHLWCVDDFPLIFHQYDTTYLRAELCCHNKYTYTVHTHTAKWK